MGVFNVQEHLRHRRNRESEESYGTELGWEEDFVEPPDAQQPQQEAAQRRTIRQRSQKSKIHHFNTKFPARKVKTGSRQMRRHENTCFLLSLVDHEEIDELDISDLVNNNTSVFASLLTNAEKMKIWNEFVSLSEEEQDLVITRRTSSPQEKEINRQSTEEELVLTERDAVVTAERSFNKIEGRIRGTLLNKRFSMGGLKHHEEEVVSYFSDDPSSVMITNIPSSFDRLLVHGVCQFLDLKSSSLNRNGDRIMEIENKRETFCVPALLLSQYLEQHR